MMKKILLFVKTLCVMNILSAQLQAPKIDMGLPQVIPPSPTVSALMKFEEVPVNNYTGVPDISIPLINIPTSSKDFNLDLSLKYHPSSIAVSEIASDVGLGWSLFAGGTISRTIRGHADEVFRLDGSTKSGNVGIYFNTNVSNHHNYYYDKISDLSQFVMNQPNEANRYYWDTVKRGKYDTQHDLWQFNFMGQSGRFYIKKNNMGILQVVPLSDYRLKIINHYTNVNGNPYTPSGFTVYDEKGYKYEFDVAEISNGITATRTTHPNSVNEGFNEQPDYISAFQLSKVYDNNGKLLLSFDYYMNYKEGYSKSTYMKRYYEKYVLERDASCMGELPKEIVTNQTNITQVRKIKTITVTDIAKILFNYTQGRNDTNINIKDQAPRLTDIILLDPADHEIKKFSFTQGYTEGGSLNTRLVLKKIETSKNGNFIERYELAYKKTNYGGSGYKKDSWGYLSIIDDDSNCNYKHSESINPYLSATIDVLQGIKYPTGGSALFNFESNTYAYIGDQAITDFTPNHENLIKTNTLSYVFTDNGTQLLPPIVDTIAILRPSIVVPADQPGQVHMMLQSFQNGVQQFETSLICQASEPSCCIKMNMDPNKGYRIQRTAFDLNYHEYDGVIIDFFKKKVPENKYLYGGGIRIKEIRYYEAGVDINNFDFNVLNPTTVPSKTVRFEYNEFTEPTRSSGSLVHPAPIFETAGTVSLDTNCITGNGYITTQEGAPYTEVKDFSEMPILSTQGGYVGYKNVKVYETGKGHKEYTYTSPIDYPEDDYTIGEPYIPSKNIDYKRGLLLSEKVFDNHQKKLTETNNTYTFDDYTEISGHKFWQGSDYRGNIWNTYNDYLVDLNQSSLTFPACFITCNSKNKTSFPGYPVSFTSHQAVIEAFGWAKLDTRQTRNFFYENGNQKVTERNETFTYNPLNKKVTSQTVITEDGQILKTNYFYHTGNSSFSQNRISEIEKVENYRNNILTDTKKIEYDNQWSGNVAYLPKEIKTSFAANPLEKNVTFDNYDSKGNLLQYTTKDGISTVIIWGYNQTQPIAKIEGAKLSDIQQSLIDSIVNASNTDALAGVNNDETSFLSALNTFRNSLSGYQITTYTYDPLIGVRSITPPSGIKESYIYDSANRLEKVIDVNGKVLKEMKYNYKN
ncbi:hypothetical protein [Chryseobacterium gallinarum]|uniref:RHS repeat protein n=1 Tax=Chryseobacterium gallinarum TaxID=1324352 RepID=A0ABX6KUY1_CHRGL|nr:hypothetical protein [Chryseobacterium gallinarum]QIY92073.1 hypothetical protein FOB44_16060 [Chryseobacterium gallinarum]